MIGLLIGVYSKTATMLFALIKSLGIYLFICYILHLSEVAAMDCQNLSSLLDYQSYLGSLSYG